MHNPQEFLKIAQVRAALQDCTPVNHYSTPEDMTHDSAVQDCVVLPQKLLKVKNYRVTVHRGSTRITNPR